VSRLIFTLFCLCFCTGQGRFGKVYTAVNNQTGELMAMKEIQLQPNDHRTIRRVAEELRIFEGIQHSNLVHYYGVEIHRVSQNLLPCLILSAQYGSSQTEKQ
jgi:serine/threonine protein kinase